MMDSCEGDLRREEYRLRGLLRYRRGEGDREDIEDSDGDLRDRGRECGFRGRPGMVADGLETEVLFFQWLWKRKLKRPV